MEASPSLGLTLCPGQGPAAAVTYQVLLLSKKRTRKSLSPASACFCSPSFSTSSGGTGMGTPLCRRPSRGILGSMIWRQKRRQVLSRRGWESYRPNHRGIGHLSTQGFSSPCNECWRGWHGSPAPQNKNLNSCSPSPLCCPSQPCAINPSDERT